tara:strand:+ start:113 stop:640 length:528 start_codon:yes stop_codon:yes gene_type:complete
MSFNLSSIHLDTTIVDSTLGLMIMGGEQQQGDSFSPSIPTDRLSTLNWTIKGTVSVYAKDMTFINTYGVGERMLVPNPDHLAMGKCVLVCTSASAEYYCLCNIKEGSYYDGEVIQLSANEERTISGCNGHFMFCSLGTANSLAKHEILTIDSDSYVVTAGAEGAIITVFHDSTND